MRKDQSIKSSQLVFNPKARIKKVLNYINKTLGVLIYSILPSNINDQVRSMTIKVHKENKVVFKIEDLGRITRYRAKSFSKKEPETISWIDSFEQKDTLLDIGANIGMYSLYAASRSHRVLAIEPEGQNFCSLTRNLILNNLTTKVSAFPLALNDQAGFSLLNIGLDGNEYGSAHHSLGNTKNQYGEEFVPSRSQGVIGVTMDEIIDNWKYEINHIKIDVDGNELLVLKGANKSLNSKSLKSILVELSINHPGYKVSIELIE